MTDITLEGLRLRERELEIDAVLIRGRILEVRANIEELQRRRGGRPRKGDKAEPAATAITPLRVAGDMHEPETETEESAA